MFWWCLWKDLNILQWKITDRSFFDCFAFLGLGNQLGLAYNSFTTSAFYKALYCTLYSEHCQTRLTCLPGPHQGPHVCEAEHQGLGQPLASADHLDNQSEVSIDDVDQSEASIHSVDQSEVTHLARGSPNVKKNTHPVFQHISHLWYILMMTHCVGTSNSGGILIFSLSFSKYC